MTLPQQLAKHLREVHFGGNWTSVNLKDSLQDISWEQATDEIAHWTKKTRDAAFVDKDSQGRTVNRCENIAWTGGCTDTNEFNYLVVKTMRSLGVCYIENQARV